MLAWLFLIAAALAAVDVNTADATALETLPGIGPGKAEAILAYRQEHGPFKSLEDLDAVNGIGPSTLANIKDMVSFGAAPAAQAGTPIAPVKGEMALAPKPAKESAKATPAPESAPAASSAGGCPVNINTADASGLQHLPGVGATKAAAILAYRTDHGAFAACSGLDAVNGIGPATLAGLTDCCVVK